MSVSFYLWLGSTGAETVANVARSVRQDMPHTHHIPAQQMPLGSGHTHGCCSRHFEVHWGCQHVCQLGQEHSTCTMRCCSSPRREAACWGTRGRPLQKPAGSFIRGGDCRQGSRAYGSLDVMLQQQQQQQLQIVCGMKGIACCIASACQAIILATDVMSCTLRADHSHH